MAVFDSEDKDRSLGSMKDIYGSKEKKDQSDSDLLHH